MQDYLDDPMHKVQWIYESPDKGNTVYRRRANSRERELVIKKPDVHSISKNFTEIVAESANDPALKEMLDKLQVYWSLRNASN
tara:strand:+ start:947 stop:1195 length:249 start_codon:yes stop_codon:yes gene_type:complete